MLSSFYACDDFIFSDHPSQYQVPTMRNTFCRRHNTRKAFGKGIPLCLILVPVWIINILCDMICLKFCWGTWAKSAKSTPLQDLTTVAGTVNYHKSWPSMQCSALLCALQTLLPHRVWSMWSDEVQKWLREIPCYKSYSLGSPTRYKSHFRQTLGLDWYALQGCHICLPWNVSPSPVLGVMINLDTCTQLTSAGF